MAMTEDHLRYMEGGVEVLEDYLLSSEMYWSVGLPSSEPGMELPRLTMGGLFLARAIVRGSQLSVTQKERFERVKAKIDEMHTRWRVAWERKCQRSFSMRLTSWRDFLEEYRLQPDEHADRYKNAVRLRTMLQLELNELTQVEEAELGLLSTMDKILRHVLQPGDFVWEVELAKGFPSEEYWFLYGYLPGKLS